MRHTRMRWVIGSTVAVRGNDERGVRWCERALDGCAIDDMREWGASSAHHIHIFDIHASCD